MVIKKKEACFTYMSDSDGNPLYATLTAANGNERAELPKLLDKIRIMGLSIIEADKGYNSKAVRLEILKRGHYPLIPYRGSKKGADKWVVRMRWKVERCISWLKRSYRRIATRWKRLSSVYEAFIIDRNITFWVKRLTHIKDVCYSKKHNEIK